MKNILLGIFDYYLDVRHDIILKKALKMGWRVLCEKECLFVQKHLNY